MSNSSEVKVSIQGSSNDAKLVLNSEAAAITNDGVSAVNTTSILEDLANEYKLFVPHNVLIQPVYASLEFAPIPNIPATSIAGAWQQHTNSKLQGMSMIKGAHNCGGTMIILLLLSEMIGSSAFAMNEVMFNNDNVQRALYYHSVILQAEVSLGLDFSAPNLDTFILQGQDVTDYAKAYASANHSANFWTKPQLEAMLVNFDTYNDAYTGAWGAPGNLSSFIKGLHAIHVYKVAELSSLDPLDITWGTSNLHAEKTSSQLSDGIVLPAYYMLYALLFSGSPLVPYSTIDANRNLAEYMKSVVLKLIPLVPLPQ